MAVNTVYTEWGWTEMEELLQCPICFELPCGPVLLCTKGHHICTPCRRKVQNCPLCKESFGSTRNFVVEELLANISVIKSLMTLSNIPIKTPNAANSTPKVQMPIRQMTKPSPPVQSRGEFPCVFCKIMYPVSRILIHLRYAHSDKLLEVESDNERANFNITYKNQGKNGDHSFRHHAIKVHKLGLFYVSEGLLHDKIHIFFRMVARTKDAQNYRYSLKVQDLIHSSNAVSCREPLKALANKNDCLVLNKNHGNLRNRNINVNITVTRDSSSEEQIIML